MPTVITHAVLGAAASTTAGRKGEAARFLALSILCSTLPDADVLAFSFHIPYHHYFGHRGFFHSPFFALLLSLAVVAIFFRGKKTFSGKRVWLWLYFFLLSASHGLLDALTDGGLGIALLVPFDGGRYFFPWRPIPVSPIGLSAFLTPRGLQVLLSEILWVWLPLGLPLFLVGIFRHPWRRRTPLRD